VNETAWILLAGGTFGLAAAWLPQAMTHRATTRHRRATLLATFLAECGRLERATTSARLAIERNLGTPEQVLTAFDNILPAIDQAAFELRMLSRPHISARLSTMQDLNQQLVFSTWPAMASDDERREIATEQRREASELMAQLRRSR